MGSGPLILNEDCNHFVYTRKAEEMTPEGVDGLVDAYAAGTQVSEIAFNVNAMRSAIPSRVKQPFWEGFDPQRGADQPMFATEPSESAREVMAHWVSNMLLLQR